MYLYYFKTQGFAGLLCRAFYLGVEADSCADAYYGDEYGAFWNGGVPRTAYNEALLVILTVECDSGSFCDGYTIEHYSVTNESRPLIPPNPLAVTYSSADFTCGYVGGCPFEIEATGLKTNVMAGVSKVLICGEECRI